MSQAYEDFSRTHSAVNEALEELDAGLKRSLSEWDGQARQAFDAAHQLWRRSAEDMACRLAGLRKAIAVAHGNYSRCEAANLAMFSRER
ncbi:MAG: WXG100 family type VII secretion target [Nocardiopsaceae bacterium]|nr:WXG100 family type VII secretion target [Nocardiopsaceae bacterium]